MNAPLLAAGLSLAVFAFLVPSGSVAAPAPAKATAKQRAQPPAPYKLPIGPASPDAELAIKKFAVAPGFKVNLVAAEPMVAHPVAFSIDERGRIFVAETFRFPNHTKSIFNHFEWLDEDLASTTVSNRVAFMTKHLGTNTIAKAPRVTDRIKLLEDRDGDGKAERASVFAEGFDDYFMGVAEGVLMRKGTAYYTLAPDLWKLTEKDGKAARREVLHTGFGVHMGYSGHEFHGLKFGPDGRLYFSMGDRAFHVQTEGRTIARADSGGVFRCNPDGSELELLCWGLRNPEELAFNDLGDFFTAENNADVGDQSRWLQILEGADYGWRIGYQYIERDQLKSVWHAEKLWHLPHPGQPAYLLPPLSHISAGPCGLAYYPGTGLPDRYRNYFFLADFRAGVGGGVWAFTQKQKGSTYEITESGPFLWEVLATDVEFGVEGGLYVSDWVQGWGGSGKGRIYRVTDPATQKQPILRETKKLLAEDFSKRPLEQLLPLLGHVDQRVRQEAQFALADAWAVQTLSIPANGSKSELARLHAIWALGQIARNPSAADAREAARSVLRPLLADANAEVCAQAVKVLGDARDASSFSAMLKLLADSGPRVQAQAAVAVGKLGRREAVPRLFTLLRDNQNRDAYLRHNAVFALTRLGDTNAVLSAARDSAPAVRLGALLVLRRWQHPAVAQFLGDADPFLVAEAAMAINDEPIAEALPQLAAKVTQAASLTTGGPLAAEPTLRRIINAHFRLGQAANAATVVSFAASSAVPEPIRVDAVLALGDWAKPSGRDRVVGLWRPLPMREASLAPAALNPVINTLLTSGSDDLRVASAKVTSKLKLTNALPTLFNVVADARSAAAVRVAALEALNELKAPRLAEAVKLVQTDPDEHVRIQANRLFIRLNPAEAPALLARLLEAGTLRERQDALSALTGLGDKQKADALFVETYDKLLAGKLPPELHLDLVEHTRNRSAEPVKSRFNAWQATKNTNDLLAGWREAFHGGNAQEGKKQFERVELACLRCHKLNGEGGIVGPDLTGIGKRQTREYLLESIVHPNSKIAVGFEDVLVVLKNGQSFAGRLKKETDTELVLDSPEDGEIKVKKADLKRRERSLSAMPDNFLRIMSKWDVRNLVEFLATQQ